MPLKPLAESAVLISGAGGGVGAALAAAFAGKGARVACADLDLDAARATAARVGGVGVGLDVRDPAMWANAVAQTQAAFGRLDVLVNNAGVLHSAWALDQTEADARAMVETNLLGAVFGLQAALPAMLAQGGGRVVTVGSMASYLPLKGQALYAATKHALRAWHFGVAAEYAGRPIAFTLVSPGAVDTAMIRRERGVEAAALSFAGPAVSAREVAAATLWAMRRGQEEICVPARGATLAKLAGLFPKRARALIDRAHAAGRARLARER
jgi:NADP-dependent 3-hydroxy acid dehydrogenase YdfG